VVVIDTAGDDAMMAARFILCPPPSVIDILSHHS